MKKLIILLFWLPLVFFSQEEFSFELYFEDALGNKDTLILGYDPLATDSIDVAFGEVNIVNQPWDSVLDVRSIMLSYPSNIEVPIFHSKKQIIEKTCVFDFKALIAISTDSYPVKITWDTLLFQTDSCRMASLLSCCAQTETDFYLGPSIFLSNLYASLVHSGDSLIIDPSSWNGNLQSYNDGSKDLKLIWLSYANPLDISTNSISDITNHKTQVFPNPTTSILYIEVSEEFLGGELKIYDILGNQVWIETIKSNRFTINNFANLSEGVYTIFLSKDAYFETQKVVKQ